MAKWKRSVLVLFVIVACVGCDQFTKRMAESHLPRVKVLSFAGDTLRFDYFENKGGVFFFEDALPKEWRGTTLTVATAFFLGLLVVYLFLTPTLRLLWVLGLSLLCGGALSNLLDRVLFGGYVIDFLSLGWNGFRTWIFNLADAAIVAGSFLSVLGIAWDLCRHLSVPRD